MRLGAPFAVALVMLSGSLAIDSKKSVIISFDKDTPQSFVEEAKNSIRNAGGQITHDYTIIRGFAAIAPETALQSMQAQSPSHGMRVEEDATATIQ